MPDYSLFGLVVRSSRPLPALPSVDETRTADVTIDFNGPAPASSAWDLASAHYLAPGSTPDATPSVEVRRAADGGFLFRYADGTAFAVDGAASRISAWWPDASTLEDTAAYLLGPVLGSALRSRGVLALHASAVLLDGRAVPLIGPSGAGKSTIAALFAAHGVPVLADDVLAVRRVEGTWTAYPAYPTLRLWPASERLLFGTDGQLPPLTPSWEKRGLALGDTYPFHAAPAPVGDLLLLAPRVDDARAPCVEPVRAADAFMTLVANTYANYLLDDRMRGAEMRALEGLLHERRVLQLVPARDPARLARVVECVRDAAAAEMPR